jgi:hypothetical protein
VIDTKEVREVKCLMTLAPVVKMQVLSGTQDLPHCFCIMQDSCKALNRPGKKVQKQQSQTTFQLFLNVHIWFQDKIKQNKGRRNSPP